MRAMTLFESNRKNFNCPHAKYQLTPRPLSPFKRQVHFCKTLQSIANS